MVARLNFWGHGVLGAVFNCEHVIKNCAMSDIRGITHGEVKT